MTGPREQPTGPPAWPGTALRLVLPSCALCDAILGDLQEEFVADARLLGVGPARARYQRRVFGVVLYAVRDFLCRRAWEGPSQLEAGAVVAEGSHPIRVGASRVARHARELARTAGARVDYRVSAALVLALGIGANTSVFALSQGTLPQPLVSALAGAGLVLLMACAYIASRVLCAGLRQRRRKPGS